MQRVASGKVVRAFPSSLPSLSISCAASQPSSPVKGLTVPGATLRSSKLSYREGSGPLPCSDLSLKKESCSSPMLFQSEKDWLDDLGCGHFDFPTFSTLLHQAACLASPDQSLKALFKCCDTYFGSQEIRCFAGACEGQKSLLLSLLEEMGQNSEPSLKLGSLHAAMAYFIQLLVGRITRELLQRDYPPLDRVERPSPAHYCGPSELSSRLTLFIRSLQAAMKQWIIPWEFRSKLAPYGRSSPDLPSSIDILEQLENLVTDAFPFSLLSSRHTAFRKVTSEAYQRFIVREIVQAFLAKAVETALLPKLDEVIRTSINEVIFGAASPSSTPSSSPALLPTVLELVHSGSPTYHDEMSQLLDKATLSLQRTLVDQVIQITKEHDIEVSSRVLAFTLPYCPALAEALSLPAIRERMRLGLMGLANSILSARSYIASTPDSLTQLASSEPWKRQLSLLQRFDKSQLLTELNNLQRDLRHLPTRRPPSFDAELPLFDPIFNDEIPSLTIPNLGKDNSESLAKTPQVESLNRMTPVAAVPGGVSPTSGTDGKVAELLQCVQDAATGEWVDHYLDQHLYGAVARVMTDKGSQETPFLEVYLQALKSSPVAVPRHSLRFCVEKVRLRFVREITEAAFLHPLNRSCSEIASQESALSTATVDALSQIMMQQFPLSLPRFHYRAATVSPAIYLAQNRTDIRTCCEAMNIERRLMPVIGQELKKFINVNRPAIRTTAVSISSEGGLYDRFARTFQSFVSQKIVRLVDASGLSMEAFSHRLLPYCPGFLRALDLKTIARQLAEMR